MEQLDFEKAKCRQALEYIDDLEAEKQNMLAEIDYRIE